jgi:class 3 adenylate cyclase/TolB-like protein
MAEQTSQRRLAAIMVADVVGYSRMMGRDETGTLTALRALKLELIHPKVTEHTGRVFKSTGDGLLADFPSVVNAVACAVEIQRGMAERNLHLSDERAIQLRIGINLGDIIVEDGDVFGDGVNVAARVESIAPPGRIAITETVRDHCGSRLDLQFEDIGDQRLKNIDRAVRVYLIQVSRQNRLEQPAARQSTGSKRHTSLAVLPFACFSGELNHQHLADGLTEDLITELSRYHHLAVIARSTTFTYKSRSLTARDIERELGVEFIVEGSIRPLGTSIRTNVQLIDTNTGAHVWADKIDREFQDYQSQDDVLANIVARLSYGLVKAAADRELLKPVDQLTAYGYFLRAELAWRNGEERASLLHALEAIKRDPAYAPSLSQLSFFYAYSLFSGMVELPEKDIVAHVEDFATRALAADRHDPFVLISVATAYNLIGKPKAALNLLDLAGEQNPKDYDLLIIRGYALTLIGQHREGLAYLEKALQLQRRVTAGYCATLSEPRYLLGDYDGALAALDMVVNPPAFIYLQKAAPLAQLGRIAEAKEAVAFARKTMPSSLTPEIFARRGIQLYALEEDKQHWLEGFRKAGIEPVIP